MNNTARRKSEDGFIEPARRAFRRVARKLRAENARLGLPLVQGDNGQLRFVKPDAGSSSR